MERLILLTQWLTVGFTCVSLYVDELCLGWIGVHWRADWEDSAVGSTFTTCSSASPPLILLCWCRESPTPHCSTGNLYFFARKRHLKWWIIMNPIIYTISNYFTFWKLCFSGMHNWSTTLVKRCFMWFVSDISFFSLWALTGGERNWFYKRKSKLKIVTDCSALIEEGTLTHWVKTL